MVLIFIIPFTIYGIKLAGETIILRFLGISLYTSEGKNFINSTNEIFLLIALISKYTFIENHFVFEDKKKVFY